MSNTDDLIDKGSWLQRLAAVLIVHIPLLMLVTLVPVKVYEVVRTSDWSNVPGLDFAGGITYPIYFAYLISRLKSMRAKFILFHLLMLLALTWIGIAADRWLDPIAILVLPSAIGAMPLPLAVIASIRRNRHLVSTCLFSTLLSLPIGLALSMLTLYGMGMSAMSGMRW